MSASVPLRRYIEANVRNDLKRKMVFVGGPRQVGKTTAALRLLKGNEVDETHPAYFNWDDIHDRAEILGSRLPSKQFFVIFDEIHKYARWRSLVKGLYDKNKSKVSFLVTGSARLDHYRRGGDSLQGRYHYYRLHPLSLNEIDSKPNKSALQHLLLYGGFPEPLLRANSTFHRRWQNERLARVVHEDLRDLERVRELSMIDLLLHHLPSCVGSPLSIRSLRQLIDVAHESVANWIAILESLYVVYRIPPYGSAKIRAVKKEQKLYFWDWSCVQNDGARFENFVASQLLKYCHFVEDTEGFRMELRYIRDTDKREIDFVVLRNNKPEFAVECKCGDTSPSPAANYFRERTDIPKFYQVHCGAKDYGNEESQTRVLPFATFCRERNLP